MGRGPSRSRRRRERPLRLGDRAGPRLRFENVKRRPSVGEFEHEPWPADAAPAHRHILQLVERGIELGLRLSERPSPEPASRHGSLEDDPQRRHIEDTGTFRRAVGPIPASGDRIGAAEHALPVTQEHRGEQGVGNLIPSPPDGPPPARSAELFPEAFRGPFGRDGDRHRREMPNLTTEESFGPRAVLLPTLPQPGAHRPLDPAFGVVPEPSQELERSVELARPDPRSEGVRRGSSAPEVLRAGPSEELREPFGVGRDLGCKRARCKAVREGPAGRGVHPPDPESPRELVVDQRWAAEELDGHFLLFEGSSLPQRSGERSRLRARPRLETEGDRVSDPSEVGDAHPEDGDGGAEILTEERDPGRAGPGPQLSKDPTAFSLDPRGGSSATRYHPTGLVRFCSSSHCWSGAKYSRSPLESIRRSPVSVSSASGHSRLVPISRVAASRRPASLDP